LSRRSDWLHEAKFNGWRTQLHKDGSLVRLYTKNEYDEVDGASQGIKVP
jgi:ATP-dependent DNA ligase